MNANETQQHTWNFGQEQKDAGWIQNPGTGVGGNRPTFDWTPRTTDVSVSEAENKRGRAETPRHVDPKTGLQFGMYDNVGQDKAMASYLKKDPGRWAGGLNQRQAYDAANPGEYAQFNADPRVMNANDPASRMSRHKAMRAHRLNKDQHGRDTEEWKKRTPEYLKTQPGYGGPGAPHVTTSNFDMSMHDGGQVGTFEKPKKKTRRAGKKKKKMADGGETKHSKEWYKKHGIRPEVGTQGPPVRPIEGQYGDSKPKDESSGTKIVVSIEPESPMAALTGKSGRKRVDKALEEK